MSSIEQLAWVKDLISGKGSCQVHGGAKLYLYDFNGEKVFYLNNWASSLGICNQVVYDCSGKEVFNSSTSASWAYFETNRKNGQLLWENALLGKSK